MLGIQRCVQPSPLSMNTIDSCQFAPSSLSTDPLRIAEINKFASNSNFLTTHLKFKYYLIITSLLSTNDSNKM